jgi:hypothetical protein
VQLLEFTKNRWCLFVNYFKNQRTAGFSYWNLYRTMGFEIFNYFKIKEQPALTNRDLSNNRPTG